MAGDQECHGLTRIFGCYNYGRVCGEEMDHAMLWRAAEEVILAAVRFLGHRVLVGAYYHKPH